MTKLNPLSCVHVAPLSVVCVCVYRGRCIHTSFDWLHRIVEPVVIALISAQPSRDDNAIVRNKSKLTRSKVIHLVAIKLLVPLRHAK